MRAIVLNDNNRTFDALAKTAVHIKIWLDSNQDKAPGILDALDLAEGLIALSRGEYAPTTATVAAATLALAIRLHTEVCDGNSAEPTRAETYILVETITNLKAATEAITRAQSVQFTDEELAWMRFFVSVMVNGANTCEPTHRRERRVGGAVLVKLGGVVGEYYPMPEPSAADTDDESPSSKSIRERGW